MSPILPSLELERDLTVQEQMLLPRERVSWSEGEGILKRIFPRLPLHFPRNLPRRVSPPNYVPQVKAVREDVREGFHRRPPERGDSIQQTALTAIVRPNEHCKGCQFDIDVAQTLEILHTDSGDPLQAQPSGKCWLTSPQAKCWPARTPCGGSPRMPSGWLNVPQYNYAASPLLVIGQLKIGSRAWMSRSSQRVVGTPPTF